MTPRYALARSLGILAVSAMIAASMWVTRHDEQISSASLEQYCEAAAIWAAEEARGVPLNQRAGQPDYRGIAAEQCPGMRPALPAYVAGASKQPGNYSEIPTRSTERQLVRH